MAIRIKKEVAASVATPPTDTAEIYLDSATAVPKYKDDAGTSHTFGTGDALIANPLSQFAATTSAQLAGVLSDETGSGAAVFATSPTLAGTPLAPTAAYGTNTTQIATAAMVQAALATVVDDGNSSTADTIDFSAGNIHKSTLTGNCTYTFTAPPTGSVVILKVVQGSGPYTVTWPGTVHWPGGTAPTLTVTNAKVDVFTFLWDGTTYFGVTSGQNYTA
jgi:hypothetical protein